ncbi:MAG: cytochrome c3 family protein [Bacteroidota bacterium]
MKKLIISAALGLMIPLMSIAQSTLGPGVTGSSLTVAGLPHNFSTQVWNTYNATTMQGGQICQPCHTPHNADLTVTDAPLWNHQFTTAAYQMYTGFDFGTLVSGVYTGYGVTAPDGTSKLCLSCHDGSIALGAYGGQNLGTPLTGGALLSTDLRNDHPISIPYDSAVGGGLHTPTYIYNNFNSAAGSGYITSGRAVSTKLDGAGKVQCTSCHGAHSNSRGYQLSMDNRGSALCLACHKK